MALWKILRVRCDFGCGTELDGAPGASGQAVRDQVAAAGWKRDTLPVIGSYVPEREIDICPGCFQLVTLGLVKYEGKLYGVLPLPDDPTCAEP